METIGERLKFARESRDMTQDALVEALRKQDPSLQKVTRMNISHVENNSVVSLRHNIFLAATKILGCDAAWLAYGVGEPFPNIVEAKAYRGENIGNTSAVSTEALLCPIVSWVQAGAFSEMTTPFSPNDYEYMPCPVPTGEGTYILKVKGESMTPKFEEGDLIFVDPNKVSAEHGKYIIAMLMDSDEATFKQLQILDGKKYLKALNPTYPPEMKFLPINGNCQIIGTVIAHVKPL